MIAFALAAVLVARTDSHPPPPPRPAPVVRSPKGAPLRVPAPRLPHYVARVPVGRTVPQPHHYWGSGAWGWNGGTAWIASPDYWGGGFWGPYAAAGLMTGAYFAYPGTPGYELLQTYGLTQTPCGPPDLVAIYGPDGSEVCAFPNDSVAPGTYSVDPQTLTLIVFSPYQ